MCVFVRFVCVIVLVVGLRLRSDVLRDVLRVFSSVCGHVQGCVFMLELNCRQLRGHGSLMKSSTSDRSNGHQSWQWTLLILDF